MSNENQSSIALAGVFGAGLALTLFIVFVAIKGFGFILALLLALLLGVIFFLGLMFFSHRPPGASAKETLQHWKETAVGAVGSSGTTASAPAQDTSPYETAPDPQPAPASEPAAPPASEPAPAPEPVARVEREPAPEPEPAPVAAPAEDGVKPATLDAPRDGAADDLKKIRGIGPKLEGVLHGMGYYHFDQIANWSPGEVAWVDENLEGFKGRVTRDDWVAQARLLADGGETEFSQKVGKGDVY